MLSTDASRALLSFDFDLENGSKSMVLNESLRMTSSAGLDYLNSKLHVSSKESLRGFGT